MTSHIRPEAFADAQKSEPVKPEKTAIPNNSAGFRDNAEAFQYIEEYSKRRKPSKPRSVKALLDAHDDVEEARIYDNLITAAGHDQYEYEPGWASEGKTPKLYPFLLPLNKFETADDRKPRRKVASKQHHAEVEFNLDNKLVTSPEVRRTILDIKPTKDIAAQDVTHSSEGTGRVTAKGTDYDQAEQESFAPREATISHVFSRKEGWSAIADNGDDLGFDVKSDLVGSMKSAVLEWAGMTTPPPKAADRTVEALIQGYLADGGDVQSFDAYRTTVKRKIKFRRPKDKHPEWAGGTGLPRELRASKRRCGVRPKTGSKHWTNTA